MKNPLKRSYETIETKPEFVEPMDVDKDEKFLPRQYADFLFSFSNIGLLLVCAMCINLLWVYVVDTKWRHLKWQ